MASTDLFTTPGLKANVTLPFTQTVPHQRLEKNSSSNHQQTLEKCTGSLEKAKPTELRMQPITSTTTQNTNSEKAQKVPCQNHKPTQRDFLQNVKSNASLSERSGGIHVRRQDSGCDDVNLANLENQPPTGDDGFELRESQTKLNQQDSPFETPQNLKHNAENVASEYQQRQLGQTAYTVAEGPVYQDGRSQLQRQESSVSAVPWTTPSDSQNTGPKIHTSTVIAESPAQHSSSQPFPVQKVAAKFTSWSQHENSQLVKLHGKTHKDVYSTESVIQNEGRTNNQNTRDGRRENSTNVPTKSHTDKFERNNHVSFWLQETTQSRQVNGQGFKSNCSTFTTSGKSKVILGSEEVDMMEDNCKTAQKIISQRRFYFHIVSANLKLLALVCAFICLALTVMWLHGEMKDMEVRFDRKVRGLEMQVARILDTENARVSQFQQRKEALLNQNTSPEKNSLFTKLLKYVEISENPGRNGGSVQQSVEQNVYVEPALTQDLTSTGDPSEILSTQTSHFPKPYTTLRPRGKEIAINVFDAMPTADLSPPASTRDPDHDIGVLLRKWGTDSGDDVDESNDDEDEDEDDDDDSDEDDDFNDEQVRPTSESHDEENGVVPFNSETRRNEVMNQNGAGLSRHIRAAGNKEVVNVKTVKKYCKQAIRKNKKHSLQSESFEGVFFRLFNYSTSFLSKSCITVKPWPSHPEACRENTIKYKPADTPLAFYLPTSSTSSKKDKHRLIGDPKDGAFTVLIPGIYLLHTNITVVDQTRNKSLGIFLNGQAVLACQRGGFRCPKSNGHGSHKYRICNIDGILEMAEGDQIEIRTLDPHTQVRLENHQRSVFRAVLLHEFKKSKGKARKSKKEKV